MNTRTASMPRRKPLHCINVIWEFLVAVLTIDSQQGLALTRACVPYLLCSAYKMNKKPSNALVRPDSVGRSPTTSLHEDTCAV